jgi:hypothetical protein
VIVLFGFGTSRWRPPVVFRCGDSWRPLLADVEARTRAARKAAGFAELPAGSCRLPLGLDEAYRCLECGAWMHRACLQAHFGESHHDLTAD